VKKSPLRTDESRFSSLPDYPFLPHYVTVTHPAYEGLRLHYVDEGSPSGLPVLLLHGCPAWSFLYRKVIHGLLASPHGQQLRVLAPDHMGCGKSDKLLERNDYTYDFYVETIRNFIQQLDLRKITLVCQDWGGPIGLRVLSEIPEHFARIVLTNTLLPNAEALPRGVAGWPGEIISQWVTFTRDASDITVGKVIQGVCMSTLTPDELAAYDAPFPDARYKQGVLNWPSLIPLAEDSPGILQNRVAWEVLEKSDIPLLTAFSDGDPSTAGWETIFQSRAKGARETRHAKIKGAGHMVQEDKGEQLATIIEDFIFQ
jgi:haloalkane dehalogenase